ncbi:MAG: hypothetical protein GY936_11460 [Ignavibacteriae bacterium]|nr:hypothetical protein [Ignavibacteriota bacterium]
MKLLDQVRETIRLKHYSIKTEKAYVNWIKRFILFHNKKHPNSKFNTFLYRKTNPHKACFCVDEDTFLSTVKWFKYFSISFLPKSLG